MCLSPLGARVLWTPFLSEPDKNPSPPLEILFPHWEPANLSQQGSVSSLSQPWGCADPAWGQSARRGTRSLYAFLQTQVWAPPGSSLLQRPAQSVGACSVSCSFPFTGGHQCGGLCGALAVSLQPPPVGVFPQVFVMNRVFKTLFPPHDTINTARRVIFPA